MSIELISKIVPKNDSFIGLIDAKHIIGGINNSLPVDVINEISHNDIGNMQGGNSIDEFYHVTMDESEAVGNIKFVGQKYDVRFETNSCSISTNGNTIVMLNSGNTVTLGIPGLDYSKPATWGIGLVHTITLGCTGYVDIAFQYSNHKFLHTEDRTIRLSQKGQSISLMYLHNNIPSEPTWYFWSIV
jgi:hypothetical protein